MGDAHGMGVAWQGALFANNCLWLAVAAAVNPMGQIKNAKCHEIEWLLQRFDLVRVIWLFAIFKCPTTK